MHLSFLIVIDLGFITVEIQARRGIPPLLLVLTFPERCEILDNCLCLTKINLVVGAMKIVGCMDHSILRGRRGGRNTTPNQGEIESSWEATKDDKLHSPTMQ